MDRTTGIDTELHKDMKKAITTKHIYLPTNLRIMRPHYPTKNLQRPKPQINQKKQDNGSNLNIHSWPNKGQRKSTDYRILHHLSILRE
jgi:hypothetical protein